MTTVGRIQRIFKVQKTEKGEFQRTTRNPSLTVPTLFRRSYQSILAHTTAQKHQRELEPGPDWRIWTLPDCSSCDTMDQEGALATVSIGLGADDQHFISVGEQGVVLSAALVQLKGECMKFLGEYLLRRNTPLEEPDEVLEESLSDDEEEEEEKSDVRI
ncbi:hypothetical protein Mapa_004542 [Marchantia paleacea]|nr:hypothetical protein Mapa_004542 [Marchantia paleacea]